MLFYSGGKDNIVIQIKKERLALFFTKDALHQSLIGAGSFIEPERHAIPLKLPKRCAKVLLVPIALCDRDLVVATSQVHSGEPTGPRQGIKGLFDPWEWKSVLSGLDVKLPVINTV